MGFRDLGGSILNEGVIERLGWCVVGDRVNISEARRHDWCDNAGLARIDTVLCYSYLVIKRKKKERKKFRVEMLQGIFSRRPIHHVYPCVTYRLTRYYVISSQPSGVVETAASHGGLRSVSLSTSQQSGILIDSYY